jgi:hypothetical protein
VTFAAIFGLGESDNTLATSQAHFTAGLNQVMANAQAAGFSGRFFIPTETWKSGAASSTVAAAQAAVRNGTTVFDSGNMDSLTTGNRQPDNTHLNDTGAGAAATLVYNAMHASGAPF